MGALVHEMTGRRCHLAARSLAGRAPGCVVLLSDPGSSAEHAMIAWDGAEWSVRDLGSTNGTLVDGKRLDIGERRPLVEGASLWLGGPDEVWRLADALPPVATARAEGKGTLRVAESGLLVLPDDVSPSVCVFEDEDGRWLVEMDGPPRPALDGERILAGEMWCLGVPPSVPGGVVAPTSRREGAPATLGTVALHFGVSRDEEHVELSVVSAGALVPLGARAHNYLLLTLARARLRDKEQASLDAAERGWVYGDDLATMLRIDAQQVSLYICRARQQLAQAGLRDAGALVERRAGSRQLRLGTERVVIDGR